jgi:hypothetical protein
VAKQQPAEFEWKAGQLGKKISKRLDKKIDSQRINEFRRSGVIPSFLVNDDDGQRRYSEDAIAWVEFAMHIKRHSGDATYEKIGLIFSAALAFWDAAQSTLQILIANFDDTKTYPVFLSKLLAEGVELSEEVAKDADEKDS